MTDDVLHDGTPAEERPELVVITGMSGAGRSEAIHTFEDLGYFCIDNIPPSFIPQLVDLAELPGSRARRLAVVSDVRGREFFDELAGEIKRLEDRGTDSRVLFLEADDDTLLRRFKETRRRHPMCDDGESILDGIRAEREELGRDSRPRRHRHRHERPAAAGASSGDSRPVLQRLGRFARWRSRSPRSASSTVLPSTPTS